LDLNRRERLKVIVPVVPIVRLTDYTACITQPAFSRGNDGVLLGEK
jgi:hypothetical protein